MTTNKTRSYFNQFAGRKGNGNPIFGKISQKPACRFQAAGVGSLNI
jgi:hypothetical protein